MRNHIKKTDSRFSSAPRAEEKRLSVFSAGVAPFLLVPLAMQAYKFYQAEFPYHIYNRTNNREFLFELHRDYPAMFTCLKEVSHKTGFQAHHFIVVHNHYHLSGSTPNANLGEVMRLFQTMVSKIVGANHHRINHIFGSRYGATVVQSETYQQNLIRYMYQNAPKSGLCQQPQDYPYSTLKYYLDDTWEEHGLFLDPLLAKMSPQERRRFLLEFVCGTPLSDEEARHCQSKLRKSIL